MTETDKARTVAEGYNGEDALDKAATQLIEREVHQCQSVLIDEVLRVAEGQGFPSWDDCENLWEGCPSCGDTVKDAPPEHDHEHQCCCGWTGTLGETEPRKVMEWYLVTDWLYRHLSERGHVVLTDDQSHWWGRCCTGQAILVDGIMQRIVCETGYHGWPQGSLGNTCDPSLWRHAAKWEG